MHLTHIRIDEIVKVDDLPCYARGCTPRPAHFTLPHAAFPSVP